MQQLIAGLLELPGAGSTAAASATSNSMLTWSGSPSVSTYNLPLAGGSGVITATVARNFMSVPPPFCAVRVFSDPARLGTKRRFAERRTTDAPGLSRGYPAVGSPHERK